MVEQTAFVTGADRGLGQGLTVRLLESGWRVYAGQYLPDWPELDALAARYPERLEIVSLDVSSEGSVHAAAKRVAECVAGLDLLINNAGVGSPTSERSIHVRDTREPQDYGEMHRMFDVNALGPLRVAEAFLPLLDRGVLKRLAFVSSEAGSINASRRTNNYGYCMSKAALNMGVRILFNALRPKGYTFRVYHPGWLRSYMRGVKNTEADLEPEEAAVPAIRYFCADLADEDRLVLRDWRGHEWPW
ncbi:MAG: SDR family NAD(P)-dependent oxidoreductase [Anaerolineae bacterium]|nr:SDR family NAD(P)-dependent oxidoreductase [Anaerolineae bacterium]